MGTYLISNFYGSPDSSYKVIASMTERGILNIFYLAVSFGLIILHHYIQRKSILYWSTFILFYAIFRIVMLDFIHFNPLYESVFVGVMPIFNNLLLNYGIPTLMLLVLFTRNTLLQKGKMKKFMTAFIFLMMFAYVSLNISQLYNGSYLTLGKIGNVEMYTYSVVWLILGIALAFFGTLKSNRNINIASLALVTITILKVFFIDAKELEGLLRVVSFLGLGLTLLGLSYFYSRFVFKK
jgi:uncharacterized membrane protein